MTEIEIIYEDDDVLVVDKPAGLLVHEDGMSTAPTVVDWFVARVPRAQGVGEPGRSPQGKPLLRSGVVHRLDTETSGVLILAKTQAAFLAFKQQFHDRLVEKEYRAFVYGRMKDTSGRIDRPIGRSAKDFRLRSAQRGAKGMLRPAVTDWELVKQGIFEAEPFAELRLKPKTGRTHQLRVHLKALDHPIVCDRLYAGARVLDSNNLGFSRLALHAHILTLMLPCGSRQTFVAPLPASFEVASQNIAEEEGLW
jgi:23S rRNA pseudouridine1911/1915/1917 synthase